ncbi:DNA-binding response regulator [Bacillus sp. MUM 116]|uniref:response regulator transcription factor n=1 Tax=Bacillus sp. MUM 116 TaxID=1678002 RepID=UPI0008F5675F|nr:response regulator transcription factor [Bacillus sp. MUM 116]OIK16520.1 DNA-binding response regulator [Bacillus sp. MUM 116]
MTTPELCRTLIVDDELLIRQGIKHYIDWEKEGFLIVGEAANGQEALELIEETNPHVMITDIVMPIMDGEELTRVVKEKYPHTEIIILSSFGEFDYVRSTFQNGVVDYILKPKLDANSLLKALNTARHRIPSLQNEGEKADANPSIGQIIQKLISGYDAPYNPAAITNVFPYSHFCLLGVKNLKRESEASDGVKEEIEKVLKTNLKEAAHTFFTVNQDISAFLININSEEITKVIELAYQLAKSDPAISFALTEVFSDFSQVGSRCKESLLKLFNYQFYLPDITLLMDKNLPKLLDAPDHFNLEWFTGEFKRRQFDSALSYLTNHAQSLSRLYTMDVFEYKAFFGNIIFNITVLLSNMEYNVKELENARYSYFRLIDDAQTAGETLQLLNRFIEEVKKCLESSQNQPENLNMKKLLEYIMDHYAEPLTLKDVAKHFHFNPSYLSNYFSTHNNEGFVEYVNKIRIEEAAKLLVKGEANISDISAMVGYSDHSYFCKVFKKIKGLSPSQFKRKQHFR